MKNLIVFLLFLLQLISLNAQKYSCECNIKLNCSVKDDSICVFVDSMPSFEKSGHGKFIEYIYSKLKFKQNDLGNLQSNYIISFVINRNGKLVRAKVGNKKKKEYSAVEKEILRVLKKSPSWIPGSCNGVKVPIYFRMILRIQI